MDDEDARTIRRLTSENEALLSANEALHGRLARLEAEFRPQGEAPQELRDDPLSLAIEILDEERAMFNESCDRMSENYHAAIDEIREDYRASIDEIEKIYEKDYLDSEAELKMNYYRLRGKIITTSIFVIVLIYASSVYFTYKGAELWLEAALRGRSLEFSLSYAMIWYIAPFLVVIAWRLWHWRHPPTPQED